MIADPVEGRSLPLRVLIVDDSPTTRRVLRFVLDAARRYEVAGEADTGAGAVELVAALRPDVVLLDRSLPDGDGSARLGPIREAAPDTRVVIMSATAEVAGTGLREAGAAGFIPKGLSPTAFVERLDAILA